MMRLLARTTIAALLATGLAGCATPASPVPPRWQLLFFHPFRPGVLQQCENAHLQPGYARNATPDPAEPGKAWTVDGPLALQVPGGPVLLAAAGAGTAARPHPVTDLCFTLRVDGQVLVSGAVVPEYSARLLRFPTLVRLREGDTSGTPRYRLQPRFPADPQEPGPPAWSVLRNL